MLFARHAEFVIIQSYCGQDVIIRQLYVIHIGITPKNKRLNHTRQDPCVVFLINSHNGLLF